MVYEDVEIPTAFDGYTIIRLIGHGGMGRVYLAHDELLDRFVAVKFLRVLNPSREARERFFIEARAIARLQHPNVVTIYRVGELPGRPYLVSEFIRGRSLEDVPRPVPLNRMLELALGLTRGLTAAHRSGVLHRDIKPANAIVGDDGEIKLLDFGLAKLVAPREPTFHPSTSPDPSNDAQGLAQLAHLSARDEKDTEDGQRPPNAELPGRDQDNLALGNAPPARSIKPPPTSDVPTTRADLVPKHKPKALALTRKGVFLGTPLYTAPEVLSGAPASYQSDVYSLGALLYELASGRLPHEAETFEALRAHALTKDAVPLIDRVPIDPRLGGIIDRCLRRDLNDRFGSAEELCAALVQLTPEARIRSVPDGAPYRGLSRFEAEHRSIFFGRNAEITTIIERLRTDPFVLIAGNSGSGKSSICRAGVTPRIIDDGLGDARTWSSTVVLPGKRPMLALASALAPSLEHLEKDIEALVTWLIEEPASLLRELHMRLGSRGGIVIFIDQLEEIVTVGAKDEQEPFARILSSFFVATPGVRVLATVRGDFLTRVAALPGLTDGLGHAIHLLRPLSREATREAIVDPARAKGVSFESERLVDELVASMTRGEGSLPLLQFALSELWAARDQTHGLIRGSALEAIGGVAGALARHADGVIASLIPEHRAAARRILLSLVGPDGTSLGRSENDLVAEDPAARVALDALIRGRLIVVRELLDGSICEVAHEALIREWNTLVRWIDDSESHRVVRERLSAAAADWVRLGRTKDGLWRPRQVAEAAIIEPEQLHPREADFLAASRRAGRRAGIARMLAALGVPAGVVLAYAIILHQGRADTDAKVRTLIQSARSAVDDARAAQNERAHREREAYALFDSGHSEDAEILWTSSLGTREAVDRDYSRGSRALENALLFDSSRQDVRGYLADAFYERALLAERDRHLDRRDELWERIDLYDPAGTRRARWESPIRLTLETAPPDAEIALARYEADSNGRLSATEVDRLTPASGHLLDLPPGSYRLTVTRKGRAPVIYPVVLNRGEPQHLRIELPLEGDVPPNFVYIPMGHFLVGTALDEDTRRGFFTTVPIHPTMLGAYLIAKTETTFADWIEYLEALPPAERASRSPTAARLSGAFALARLDASTWQLKMQPTRELYIAKSGEKIVYGSRERRSRQDWLKLPVFGISSSDAEAYTRWLSQTGRVPGARPCTEYEWERAARGADDRPFPSGARLEPDDANFDETYGREPLQFGPDEVSSHPASRSPFGIDDLAGNVWEWTRGTIGGAQYVLRGGSYYHDRISSRSDNRQIPEPSVKDITVGFRVCADVPRR